MTNVVGILKVLAQHEIKTLAVVPQPYEPRSKTNGFDITIVECMCGHTSPLGSRSVHLATELQNANV